MKKILVGTSAFVGVGLMANPAYAADGIKLGLGGFFRTSVNANIDNNGQNDLGNGRDVTEVTSAPKSISSATPRWTTA